MVAEQHHWRLVVFVPNHQSIFFPEETEVRGVIGLGSGSVGLTAWNPRLEVATVGERQQTVREKWVYFVAAEVISTEHCAAVDSLERSEA